MVVGEEWEGVITGVGLLIGVSGAPEGGRATTG